MTGYEDRHNYNSKCDDDDFMVAADFTLYSNPINRALYRPPPDEHKSPKSTEVKADPATDEASNGAQQELEKGDWIASDMTKYESPLAEMEKQGRDRDARLAHTKAPVDGEGETSAPAADP